MSVLDELANPATPPERLHRLATQFPQYAGAIAQHPNAYPELIAWCRDLQTSMQADRAAPNRAAPEQAAPDRTAPNRAALWWILCSAAAVLIVALVVGIVVWLAPEQEAPTAAPRSTASPAPTPETTPLRPVEDSMMLDPERWRVVGEVLVSEEANVLPSEHTVSILSPGGEIQSFILGDALGLVDRDPDLRDLGWAVHGGASPGIVFFSVHRVPASGLDPESFRVDTAAFDAEGARLGGTVLAEGLTAEPELEHRAGSSDGAVAVTVYDGEYRTFGVSAKGVLLWEKPGAITDEMYGAAFIESREDLNCLTASSISIADGRTLWSRDNHDRRSSSGDCIQTVVGLAETKLLDVVPVGGMAMMRENAFGDQDLFFDLLTGDPLLPQQNFALIDSAAGLAWAGPAFFDEDRPWAVHDLRTGESLFEIAMSEKSRLGLEGVQLLDGYLYTLTTDGSPIIRVSDGEVVADNSERYPITRIGGWWYFSDGLLTNAPYTPGS